MSISELCFIFAALVMVLAPAYASEENTLGVENITSISAIVNPVTSNLAKSVGAAPAPQVTDKIPGTPGFSSLLAGIMLMFSMLLIKRWNA
jgi:hypothetical protein